jgi:biotin transport system substrate-specific component
MQTANSPAYNKDIITSRNLTAVIGVAFFVLVTILGAYVRIPVAGSPVPITLQTFFVILSGAVLGKKLGSASQISYILLGVIGLPVFQGASFGAAYLTGPTGGYLIGFVAAAYLTGRLATFAKRTIGHAIAVFATGSLVIYTCGALWLASLYGAGLKNAFMMGILPFIPGDLAKILAAAVIFSAIAKRSNRIFSA